nr:PREDICTED: uncharacterized protein LOC103551827 [Equus przewalskii]
MEACCSAEKSLSSASPDSFVFSSQKATLGAVCLGAVDFFRQQEFRRAWNKDDPNGTGKHLHLPKREFSKTRRKITQPEASKRLSGSDPAARRRVREAAARGPLGRRSTIAPKLGDRNRPVTSSTDFRFLCASPKSARPFGGRVPVNTAFRIAWRSSCRAAAGQRGSGRMPGETVCPDPEPPGVPQTQGAALRRRSRPVRPRRAAGPTAPRGRKCPGNNFLITPGLIPFMDVLEVELYPSKKEDNI